MGMRYRCTLCGNLTRFDVTTARRTRAFHHFTVGGELRIEETDVLSEEVLEVICRWCGHGRAIETIAAQSLDPNDESNSSSATAPDGPPREAVPS